jgi:hypothetical protein
VTHTARVLALLSDGKPHTHHELYALGVIAHSRVADLRKQGHVIACWTAKDNDERVSVYQLVQDRDFPLPLEAAEAIEDAPAASSGSGEIGSGQTSTSQADGNAATDPLAFSPGQKPRPSVSPVAARPGPAATGPSCPGVQLSLTEAA